jgi:transposase-like protein
LDSWLEATATRYCAPLGDIIRAVGITSRRTYVPGWLLRLDDEERQRITHTTGLDEAAIAAMTLAHYDGTALEIDLAHHCVNRAFPFGCRSWSRYCPECLAESGGRWQLHWRLGWTFACTRHCCLLADYCPRCGRRQRKTHHGYKTVPLLGHCGGTAGSPCGADLTATPVSPLPDHHPVIEAQKTLFEIIGEDRSAFGLYARQPCSAREALTDIKVLASRILAYAADNGLAAIEPQCGFNLGAGERVHWRYRNATTKMNAPQIAVEAAVAITAALAVLGSADVASAADKVRWLVAGQLHRGGPNALRRYARDGGLVAAVLLKVFAPPAGSSLTGSHMQLRYRTTLPVPTSPEFGKVRLHQTARRLPSMLWPNWSIQLQLRRSSFWYFRCLLSCATLLVGTTATVEEAIAALGGVIDADGAKNAISQLQQCPHWAAVCTAVTRLSEYLNDTPVPIDYRRRRRLDYATLLTGDRWMQVCRQTGALPGKSEGQKALIARAHLYQKISGRPAHELLQGTPPATREGLVQRIANFPRRITPEVARLLDEESRNFLRAKHIDEPITWSPPLELVKHLDLPEPDPAQTTINELHAVAADMTLSITEIAGRLNTSAQAVRYLLDEHPTQPRNRSAVESARAHTCPAITADVLKELYVQQGNTLNQIAAQFGTTRHTVKRLLVRGGLPIRHRPPPPSGDWLYEQHIIRRRTLTDIAKDAGVHPRAVYVWKKRHQLAARGDESSFRRRPMSRRTAREVLEPCFAAHAAPSWLTNFIETLRYPTMQAAAAELNINPATLQYRITALERTFGEPLVFRARHGLALRPTNLGEQVAEAISVINPQKTQ